MQINSLYYSIRVKNSNHVRGHMQITIATIALTAEHFWFICKPTNATLHAASTAGASRMKRNESTYLPTYLAWYTQRVLLLAHQPQITNTKPRTSDGGCWYTRLTYLSIPYLTSPDRTCLSSFPFPFPFPRPCRHFCGVNFLALGTWHLAE